MSTSTLIQEIESMPHDQPLDWPAFSERLNKDFKTASTSEDRGDLLAVRATAFEIVVNQLQLFGEQLEKFIDACELEYKRLIVHETLVDGRVSYEAMLHVTDREIAAGRMSDDYALRVIAIEETPQHIHATAPSDIAPATEPTNFAKLKHWLRID